LDESEHVERHNRRSGDELEAMGRQIRSYERQVREYLAKIDANVDTYNFSVEKNGDALTIEVGLRATIRARGRNSERDS
jgi:hypothetical protein